MSGIVGIVNTDGAPVDRAVLERMTSLLAFRGPDAQNIWNDGPAGFGHALLRTSAASQDEPQPCSLDGTAWIVADARLDARQELVAQLSAAGRAVTPASSSAHLLLHAYHAWGEGCVEHLLGDFVFAIWDAQVQRLFCARDHFGVKPFFYARVGRSLLFSNTLDCLRSHPAVSNRLNDLAIADFLVFGLNQDLATTAFADIERLPPAHSMTSGGRRVAVSRYWTLPVEPLRRFRHDADCVAQFRDLLEAAVRDRVQTSSVAVSLSGGLDSGSVAAIAGRLRAAEHVPAELRAFTMVYDRLIPDRERHFAEIVARSIGAPIEFLALDDLRLFDGFQDPEWFPPEPLDSPLPEVQLRLHRQMARLSRVALTGEGGDPGMAPSLSYYLGPQFGRLLTGTARYLLTHGRLPRIGFRISFLRWLGRSPKPALYPGWLNLDLEARLGLQKRWQEFSREGPDLHPVRPYAYKLLASPYWSSVFESYDPGYTRVALEFRHPLFDVRVQRFLLSLPSLPWCADKELFRLAMRGVLPEEIRCRVKTPLAGDPVAEILRGPDSAWVNRFEPHPEFSRYVTREKIPVLDAVNPREPWWLTVRAVGLNVWLKSSGYMRYK